MMLMRAQRCNHIDASIKAEPKRQQSLGISHIIEALDKKVNDAALLRNTTIHPRTPSDIIATMLLPLLLLPLHPRQAALQRQARNARADVAPDTHECKLELRDKQGPAASEVMHISDVPRTGKNSKGKQNPIIRSAVASSSSADTQESATNN